MSTLWTCIICNKSSSGPNQPTTESAFERQLTINQNKFLFQSFCQHFKFSQLYNSKKIDWDFNQESIPFCPSCITTVKNLIELDRQENSIQQALRRVENQVKNLIVEKNEAGPISKLWDERFQIVKEFVVEPDFCATSILGVPQENTTNIFVDDICVTRTLEVQQKEKPTKIAPKRGRKAKLIPRVNLDEENEPQIIEINVDPFSISQDDVEKVSNDDSMDFKAVLNDDDDSLDVKANPEIETDLEDDESKDEIIHHPVPSKSIKRKRKSHYTQQDDPSDEDYDPAKETNRKSTKQVKLKKNESTDPKVAPKRARKAKLIPRVNLDELKDQDKVVRRPVKRSRIKKPTYNFTHYTQEGEINDEDYDSDKEIFKRIRKKDKSREQAEDNTEQEEPPKRKRVVFQLPGEDKFIYNGFEFSGNEAEKFKCSHVQCEHKVYSQKKDVVLHIRRVHLIQVSAKDHLCHECGKSFPSEYQLKRHVRTHIYDDKTELVPCPTCGCQYKGEILLRKHIASMHTRTTTVLCQYCSAVVASQNKLRLHVERFHADPRFEKIVPVSLKCDYCDCTFMQPYSVIRHMKVYHKEISFDPSTLPAGTGKIKFPKIPKEPPSLTNPKKNF